MRSNVCKIEKGTGDLEAILKECEKVAVYNELTHKQSLQLRLLCEETDGMLVSPKDIDEVVDAAAKIISAGINQAFGRNQY